MNEIVGRDGNGRFVDGHAGLGGRPFGARHAFSAAFVRDLAEVWSEHGKATMEHCARTDPTTFFATCARILPKDVELTVRQHYSAELDPADLAILRAIRDSLPGAGNREAGEVLRYVSAAVEAYRAKLIERDTERDIEQKAEDYQV